MSLNIRYHRTGLFTSQKKSAGFVGIPTQPLFGGLVGLEESAREVIAEQSLKSKKSMFSS